MNCSWHLTTNFSWVFLLKWSFLFIVCRYQSGKIDWFTTLLPNCWYLVFPNWGPTQFRLKKTSYFHLNLCLCKNNLWSAQIIKIRCLCKNCDRPDTSRCVDWIVHTHLHVRSNILMHTHILFFPCLSVSLSLFLQRVVTIRLVGFWALLSSGLF